MPGAISLLPISKLKVHEETFPDRVARVKNEIAESGSVLTPLWVDQEHCIVLNGHHRLAALKELGCVSAPAFLMNYKSSCIRVGVCPGASISPISKAAVIEAALSGRPLPPRSSLHSLNFNPPDLPTPLETLAIKESQPSCA